MLARRAAKNVCENSGAGRFQAVCGWGATFLRIRTKESCKLGRLATGAGAAEPSGGGLPSILEHVLNRVVARVT
jgi:hypothetical protein